MPKNAKRSSGGTPKNFDPNARHGAASGSRSPGHRGYRPDEQGAGQAGAKKPRWSSDERVARGRSEDRRGAGSTERAARPASGRDDRDGAAPRRFERDDRAPRRFEVDGPARPRQDDRPAFGGGRRESAPRADSSERQPRRFDRDDRAPRRFEGDRPARPAYGRDDRAPRRFEGDRPARPAYGRDDRAPRRFERDDRPRRVEDDRPQRRESKFYGDSQQKRVFTDADDRVLEKLQAEATEASDVDGVTFDELGLGRNIVAAVAELGAARPFPIQAATIPDVLAGRDVLGRGRTGSGKTIAFAAPLVERLAHSGSAEIASGSRSKRQFGRAPRALILAPTRELALQIDRTVQPIARSVGLFTTQIYGGVPQRAQVMALERGVDIVIGTPGRIEDLIEQGRLDLSHVQITVLDEADHMCDLGFLEPVQRILRLTSTGGQKLLFSATLDAAVAGLIDEFFENPAVHEVAGEDQASSDIEHRVYLIDHREKVQIIERLVRENEAKTLVFARTRAYAEDLADMLVEEGVPATSLHGDLNQAKRTRNLERLTQGKVRVLVATDVAARGIHVDDIDLVIQADPPDEYKTYLHRSGRTGRAGKKGVVVTLVSRNRRRKMEDMLDRAEIVAEWSDYPAR